MIKNLRLVNMTKLTIEEQLDKKKASLVRHQKHIERLHSKTTLTDAEHKKLSREKYLARKTKNAIGNIESWVEKQETNKEEKQ